VQYSLHSNQHHFGWDNSIPSEVSVDSGSTLEIKTLDSSAGQLTAESTVAELVALDFARVNPVTGPIFVNGAQPGDAIKITFESFVASGWGWTGNIPGFGLLADDFKEPALHIWKYDASNPTTASFSKGGSVALNPFVGTVGLALAEAGNHSVVPPRHVGGNLDIKDMRAGTELLLPVEVAGGLLSIGDTHAAQGDGEVCGTAIESQMDVIVKIDLIKDAKIKSPQFVTTGPAKNKSDQAGHWVTTGVGPDLFSSAQTALRQMVELLTKEHKNLDPVDAYMLCSVAGDLRISEIVDMPNWVVSFYFPKSVFN
jgi:acetamidase/formamidase